MKKYASLVFLAVFIIPLHAKADMLSRREARLQQRLAQRELHHDLQSTALSRREARLAARHIRLELNDQLGDKSTIRMEVVRLVNIERAKVDLPALTYNKALEESAQAHAEDMLSKGYFSHFSQTGDNFVDRMKAADYGTVHAAFCNGCSIHTYYGENIAKGQRTAQEVVTGWMNSEPHRKNILSTDFEEIGIGVAGVFWVQNFGAIKTQGPNQ